MVRLHLTEAYGVRGAFNHNWDPFWSTSFWGSYASVRHDNVHQAAAYCAIYTASAATGGAAGKSADYSCNPDFNIAQVGAVTRWTPVKNLTFSAEVGAFFLDQKYHGLLRPSPATAAEADRSVRVQGPEHGLPERSRSAQLLIPKDLKH